jgi:hypothetical protein
VAIAVLDTWIFRGALARMARYKRLTCPEKIRVIERGEERAVSFVWLLAGEWASPEYAKI